jgi:hypothetical protein
MTNRHLACAVALALTGTAGAQAHAQTLEERVLRLEEENRRQAVEIAEQKQRLEGAPQRVEQLAETMAEKQETGGGWFDKVVIAGLVEVETFYSEPFGGGSESDVVLATFELGIGARVTDWVEVGASLLYEEDDTDLEVDVAFITIANLDVSPVYFTAGQIYVPFGAYETNLVSDPLTLEIGETRETAAQLGFVYEGFSGSVYAFNGDNKVDGENEIGGWGANLAYAMETDTLTWTVGVGYINDLGDSDSLHDTVADNREAVLEELDLAGDPAADTFSTDPVDRTAGWTANLAVIYGDFNFIAEYLSATDDFDSDSLSFRDSGARPSAWNIEVAYSFDVLGKESVAAVAYQGTDEAVALELPKESWLVGWSIGIFDNTALSFEYRYDTDYSTSEGGTGDNGSTVIAQLAVEF